MHTIKLSAKILRITIRPIVRLFIKHGHSYHEAVEILRAEYIEVAKEDLVKSGHDINISRLSAVTGIGRREVSKSLKAPITNQLQASIAARVLGAWQHNKTYKDSSGKIRDLTIDGKNSEFFSLVSSITKDINPYTILFELERTNAVERVEKGKLRILSHEFIPNGSPEDGFEILSADLSDLIQSVDDNIFCSESKLLNLHLKTEYTNIRKSALPTIREWLLKEGSEFHSRIRNFISQFDVDINPSTNQQTGVQKEDAGVRVALGTFSRIENRKQ